MVCVLGFVDTLCKCVCSYKYFTKTLQHTCGMRMNTLNARYVQTELSMLILTLYIICVR